MDGVSITRKSSSTKRCFQTPLPSRSFRNTSVPKSETTSFSNFTRIRVSSSTSRLASKDTLRGPTCTSFLKRVSSRKTCCTSPTKGPTLPFEPPGAVQYKRSQVPVRGIRAGWPRQFSSKAVAAASICAFKSSSTSTPFFGAFAAIARRARFLPATAAWLPPRLCMSQSHGEPPPRAPRSSKSDSNLPCSCNFATPPRPPSLQPPSSTSAPNHVDGMEVRPVRRPNSARTALPSGSKSHS
mmetsp:Transcript_22253/g.62416  ORF Transcript_22253/g.62416 Transcript_22253/m.62416 type:complete len:240 (+) Transcript_22253:274-993(+)